jgi:two-component system, sensor histidine kinase
MIPARAHRMLTRILRPPRPVQGLIGLAGGGLAALALFSQLHWPGAARLSFTTTIMMMAEITGGWPASVISIVTLIIASMVWRLQTVSILSVATVAALCGALLRRGVRPWVAVLMLTAVTLLSPALVLGVYAPVTWSTLAVALLEVSLYVGLSIGLMTLLPRRSAGLLPQRRRRLDDAFYVLGTMPLAAVALTLTEYGERSAVALVMAVLGVNLTVFVLGMRAEHTALELLERLRAGRPAGTPPDERRRYATLPLETALLFLGARRESDRLHRLTARQGLHLESARRRVARLQLGKQIGERLLREKQLALANAVTANTAIESRWRAFLETIPSPLLIADSAGVIQYANGAVQGLLGHSPASLIGTAVSALLEPVASASDPLEIEPIVVAGDPEPPARESDVRVRDAAGTTREFTVCVQGFYVQADRRLAIRLSPISRHKYIAQELKEARAAEVATQRARDQLIATMSHEIRTPLHGLMATLDMLRSEAFSPEGSQRLAIARTSAKTLINIANDILDLSRISAGGMSLERKPISLENLIGEVVDEARARAESMQLEVRTWIDGQLPPSVWGDPMRIRQIVSNLLANALKFTSAGSVTLYASYAQTEWTLDVIDTGQGVPADKRESIFEPFVQADSESSRRLGGAGLGLAISRKLCEAMGGSLVLAKTGASGSTFRLELPLPISAEMPVDENSQRILQVVHGHVLVVEDDQVSRYVAQSLLESLQCPARIASGGAEALELLQEEEFDLVLVDCEMPEIDGYETTRRARKLLARHIPIIAMTAGIMAADRQRCFNAGMDDILSKPFSKAALNDMLCKWLAARPLAADDRKLPDRVAALVILDVSVFEELRESLRWQLAPLRKLYASFQESANDAVRLLADSPERADEALAARRLHSLQGSAGLVGARQIEHLAAWFTEAIKQHDWQEIGAAVPLLLKALRRFQQELEGRVDSVNGK